MDDEDLVEQSEAQQLGTQGAFAGLGTDAGDASSNGMFSDLFKTTGETVGFKLLQHMGWRQGQGVGQKVKRRAEGDKTGEMHLFAPENTQMINLNRKTDRKGLGFKGESSLGDLSGAKAGSDEDHSDVDARILSASRSKFLAKPKKLKKSSIGIGVLNDTGSDDEDPYAIGPQINYSRIIGGDKRKRKGGLVASATVQRPTFTSKKPSQQPQPNSKIDGFRRCHDGRLPLDGFVLSLNALNINTDTGYSPPTVPEGWKPSKRATKFDTEARFLLSTVEMARSSSLDPRTRAAILGEAALPGKSVFDFLSQDARAKLVAVSGRADLPQARGEGAPAGFEAHTTDKQRTLWDLVPQLEAHTAAAALHRGQGGWMPYVEDEAKQKRYRAFLSLRAMSQQTPVLPTRAAGVSIDDWAKELREFSQAAQVFKPISGLMATRFAPSTSAPALASDVPFAPVAKPLDPADEAAKVGMYGPLTRSKYSFYPTRLLCKRFNVNPPASLGAQPSGAGVSNSGETTHQGTGDLISKAALDRMMMHAGFSSPKPAPASTGVGDVEGAIRHAATEHASVDVETNEALEGSRPDAKIFKSVFEDEEC